MLGSTYYQLYIEDKDFLYAEFASYDFLSASTVFFKS